MSRTSFAKRHWIQLGSLQVCVLWSDWSDDKDENDGVVGVLPEIELTAARFANEDLDDTCGVESDEIEGWMANEECKVRSKGETNATNNEKYADKGWLCNPYSVSLG